MDQVPTSPEAGGLRGSLVQGGTGRREALLHPLAIRRHRGSVHGPGGKRVVREPEARSS